MMRIIDGRLTPELNYSLNCTKNLYELDSVELLTARQRLTRDIDDLKSCSDKDSSILLLNRSLLQLLGRLILFQPKVDHDSSFFIR